MKKKKRTGIYSYKIYTLRKDCGYTQWQLGKRIGVSRQTISRWETSSNDIKTENLRLLCEAFGVEMSYFLIDQSVANNDGVVEAATTACEVEEQVKLDEPVQELAQEPIQEAVQEETNEVAAENANEVVKNNKLTVKAKKMVIALSVCLVLFVIALSTLIGTVYAPILSGMNIVDDVSSITFNFSPQNIAQIFLGVIAIVAVCVAGPLIAEVRKSKSKCN